MPVHLSTSRGARIHTTFGLTATRTPPAVSLLGVTCALALAACGGSGGEGPAPSVDRSSESHADDRPAGRAPTPESGPAEDPSDAAIGALMLRANTFGFELYQRVRTRPGNLVLSPTSVHLTLSMAYAGARGTTAAQMREVLHVGTSDDALHAGYGAALNVWNATPAATIRVASRLFASQGMPLDDAFLAITRERYGAPVELLDFEGALEPSRVAINTWAEQRTEDRVHELFPPGSLTAQTRLVLANAVYFKGTWRTPFDPAATEARTFLVNGTAETNVPTMSARARFRWGELSDGLSALELPYSGGQLSMLLLLPNQRGGQDSLDAIEGALSQETLTRWRGDMSEVEVEVRLPRFRLEPASMSLTSALQALGMPAAFRAEADFGGISAGARELQITEVFHKAFLEVDEEGTEAAAATGVVLSERSARRSPTFIADHPFVFLIVDRRSGAVLFIGRVRDPR